MVTAKEPCGSNAAPSALNIRGELPGITAVKVLSRREIII
jgi:hypothetical protein